MRPFRPDIVAEHVDEAAFLARLRGTAFESHAQTLGSLRSLEDRLLAQLDGVVVAEASGWEAAAPLLGSKRAAEGFVASFVALSSPAESPLEALAAAIPSSKNTQGLRHGFRLARGAQVSERLTRLRHADDPLVRSLAADALAFRGEGIGAASVRDFLTNENPEVVRNGLELAARLPLAAARKLEADIAKQLASQDRAVLSAAVRAGLRLGMAQAGKVAIDLAREGDAHGARALSWLSLAGDAATITPLLGALADPKTARAATLALARHGHPNAAPALVAAASDPKLARVAAYALARLTGLDPTTVAPVAGSGDKEAKADEEGLDTSYLDDDFVEADPARLREWWASEGSKFGGEQRLRRGAPLAWETLLDDARGAVLPEREAAILELRLRMPDLPPFETRGWVSDQESAIEEYAGAAAQAARGKALHDWPVSTR